MAGLWRELLGGTTQVAQRSTPEGATIRATGGNVSTYNTGDGADVTRAVKAYYERVIWVFRCVDAIATKVSSLPIVFREGKRDMLAPEGRDDDLQRVLNRRPNKYETAFQFRYRVSSLLNLSERGVFIEIVRSNSGGIAELHILPPDRVEPVPDPRLFIRGYNVSNGENGVDFLLPHQVLWIKGKPHPTDPYRQMTPLTAARIAADTDFMARTFNANFLRNDGRPGMLITIEDLNPDDADELQRRFGGGGSNAGRTTIIEGRGLDIADMSSSPRDAMWIEAINASKQDILLAFGTPESVLGNASGRTYDNADAEDVGWWNDTLIPHGQAMAEAYDAITEGGYDDEIHVLHDLSGVDALQQVDRNREQNWRDRFVAGTATLDQYLEAIGKEPMNTPQSRSYWQLPGKVPIGSPDDMKAIQATMAPPEGAPGQAPAFGGDGAVQPAQLDAAVVEAQQNPELMAANAKLRNLLQLTTGEARQRANPRGLAKRPKAHKALLKSGSAATIVDDPAYLNIETKADRQPDPERVQAEATTAGLIEAWSERQIRTAQERLRGTKARRGTRHWTGEVKADPVALDSAYVVRPEQWSEDLRQSLQPLVLNLINKEIARQSTRLGFDANAVDGIEFSDSIADYISQQAITQTGAVQNVIDRLEESGGSVDDMRDQIARLATRRSAWARGLATQLVTAAMEGTKNVVAEQLGNVRKTWHAVMDDATRASHRSLDDRSVYARNPFRVGGVAIRYPGDPAAPIGETAGCRCWLSLSGAEG